MQTVDTPNAFALRDLLLIGAVLLAVVTLIAVAAFVLVTPAKKPRDE